MAFPKGHKINLGRKFPNRGPCPVNVKEKISKALRGRMPKNILLIAGANRGKNWTVEQRVKCSGKNASNWKGGITKLQNAIRHTAKYKDWRTKIFKRDKFHCVTCGGAGVLNADHFPKTFSKILEVNNITSLEEAFSCRDLWTLRCGRTLCVECHKNTETYGKNNPKEKASVEKDIRAKLFPKKVPTKP